MVNLQVESQILKWIFSNRPFPNLNRTALGIEDRVHQFDQVESRVMMCHAGNGADVSLLEYAIYQNWTCILPVHGLYMRCPVKCTLPSTCIFQQ